MDIKSDNQQSQHLMLEFFHSFSPSSWKETRDPDNVSLSGSYFRQTLWMSGAGARELPTLAWLIFQFSAKMGDIDSVFTAWYEIKSIIQTRNLRELSQYKQIYVKIKIWLKINIFVFCTTLWGFHGFVLSHLSMPFRDFSIIAFTINEHLFSV